MKTLMGNLLLVAFLFISVTAHADDHEKYNKQALYIIEQYNKQLNVLQNWEAKDLEDSRKGDEENLKHGTKTDFEADAKARFQDSYERLEKEKENRLKILYEEEQKEKQKRKQNETEEEKDKQIRKEIGNIVIMEDTCVVDGVITFRNGKGPVPEEKGKVFITPEENENITRHHKYPERLLSNKSINYQTATPGEMKEMKNDPRMKIEIPKEEIPEDYRKGGCFYQGDK